MKANAMFVSENRVRQALREAASAGLNAQTIGQNPKLYNDLAEAAQDFFGKVALSQVNRNKIANGIDEELDAVVDECTMHMLTKLGAVLEVRDAERIPFLVRMANNRISDLERRDRSHLTKSTTMDDVQWSGVRDNSDVEEDVVEAAARKQLLSQVLKTMAGSGKPLTVVSLLSTTVLEKKPAQLAQELMEQGLPQVLKRTVSEVCQTFRMDTGMFDEVLRKSQTCTENFGAMPAQKVAARISNAIYTGRAETRKAVQAGGGADWM